MDADALQTAHQMPVEDAIWTINVQDDFLTEDSDDEEKEMRMIAIVDGRGTTVGLSCRTPEQSLCSHLMTTLLDTMHKPLSWKPRRPRSLILPAHCLQELPRDFSSQTGVSILAQNRIGTEPALIPNPRACSVCRRRGNSKLFETCPDCQTVFYCSKICRQKDCDHSRNERSHREQSRAVTSCSKMKAYSTLIFSLEKLPFTFAYETSRPDFDDKNKKSFLERLGLYGQGLWKHECSSASGEGTTSYGELPQENPCVLEEGRTLQHTTPCPTSTLVDWEAYYTWRGFPLSSPLAAVMTYVMTVYHVMATCVPRDFPEVHRQLSTSGHVRIHLLGAEKEADMVSLYSELGRLLPDYRFDLLLIGPHISKKVHKTEATYDNVTLRLHRGLYHNYDGTTPDVAIGLNAGLGAYTSWAATLRKLQQHAIPAYFTDYCRYSCDLSRQAMQGLALGEITEPCTNPFRSPLRLFCEEHLMPWFSNAFLFCLHYNSTPRRRQRSLSQGATADLES